MAVLLDDLLDVSRITRGVLTLRCEEIGLQSVIEAAVLRLRPILMTTGAMVLGALPLALATGAGAESRQQIGWVIVGGLLLGTFFTLFVVPTVYTLLAARKMPEPVAV